MISLNTMREKAGSTENRNFYIISSDSMNKLRDERDNSGYELSKSIKLSITDLEEAKTFAAGINESISQKQAEVFSSCNLNTGSQLAENGTYNYNFKNESFSGDAKLVVGWDMQHVNGENKKFMALNFNNKFGNSRFRESIADIEKLPDKGYFSGMFIGGFLSFAGCMGYAYYTKALDVFSSFYCYSCLWLVEF